MAHSLAAGEPYLRAQLLGETVLTLGAPLHEWRRRQIDALSSHGLARLPTDFGKRSLTPMKLRLDNLPAGLQAQRGTLTQCLEAMHRALPVREVYLFGSFARGEARPDSDVDLCIVADGAERQQAAARVWRRAMRGVWPCPALTLIPISPQRLAEKRAVQDHFFATVFREGILLASEN